MSNFEKIGIRREVNITSTMLLRRFEKKELKEILDSDEAVALKKAERMLGEMNTPGMELIIKDTEKFSAFWGDKVSIKIPKGLSNCVGVSYIDSVKEYAFFLETLKLQEKLEKKDASTLAFVEEIVPGYQLKKIFEPKIKNQLNNIIFNEIKDLEEKFEDSFLREELRRRESEDLIQKIRLIF